MRLLLLTLGIALFAGPARAQEPPTPPPVPEPSPVVEPPPVEPLPGPLIPERTHWRYIVIHHSASPSGNAAVFDAMHRRKGWDGVAYHFVIDNGKGNPDGHVEVGTRWKGQKHGAHAGGLPPEADPEARNSYNEFGIGICLVGNFEKRAPTRAQVKALARLVNELRIAYDIPIPNIVGHRHVRSTACPGRYFPWRTLFAMLDLPKPDHLFRRAAAGTHERCRWCLEKTLAAIPPAFEPLPPPVTPAEVIGNER